MTLITQFLLFLFYAGLIILTTKYIMIFYIRKISQLYNLNPNMTGQITGYATSAPELIGGIAAASVGMISTSLINVLSSNIINVFLFLIPTIFYRQLSKLMNKRFVIELIIIIISIALPITLIITQRETSPMIIPFFIILYALYIVFNRAMNLTNDNYFEDYNEVIVYESKTRNKMAIFYILMLFLSIFLLYLFGNRLSIILENLGKTFGISEIILGIMLGLLTSLPELTSFSESYVHHKERNDLSNNHAAIEALNNLTSSNVSNLLIIQTLSLGVYLIIFH